MLPTKEKLREFRFEEPKIELEDRDYNRLLKFAKKVSQFYCYFDVLFLIKLRDLYWQFSCSSFPPVKY
jgi:hypothetical protein